MDQGSRQVLTVARSVLEQLDVEVVLDRVLDGPRADRGALRGTGVLDQVSRPLSRFLTSGIDEPTGIGSGRFATGRACSAS